jgi:hypothetical protein
MIYMNSKLTLILILFAFNKTSFAQQISNLSESACKIEEKNLANSIIQTFKLDSLNQTATLLRQKISEKDKLYIKKAEPFYSNSLVGKNFVDAKILKNIFNSNHPSLAKYKIKKIGPTDPKPSRWAQTMGEYNRIDKQIQDAVTNNSSIVYKEWSDHLKGASGDQRSLGVTEYPYPIVSYESNEIDGLTSISSDVEYSELSITYKPNSKDIDKRFKDISIILSINTNTGKLSFNLESNLPDQGVESISIGGFVEKFRSADCKYKTSSTLEVEIINSLAISVQDDNRSFIKPDTQPAAIDNTRVVLPQIIEQ